MLERNSRTQLMIAGCGKVSFRFRLAKVTVKRKRDMSLHFLNYCYRHAIFRCALQMQPTEVVSSSVVLEKQAKTAIRLSRGWQ